MAYSKVILNGATLMDVTQKTVTPSTLLSGTTALKNDGTDITGTYVPSGCDVSDTTATASDVLSGKYFYTAAGVRTQGTVTVYNGAHHSVSSGYSITVSLTNPINPQAFVSCQVYEADAVDDQLSAIQLDMLTSPTETVTVITSKPVLYIITNGVSLFPGTTTCSGGVTLSKDYYDGTQWFSVSGNGTIVFDGNDYDD